MRQPLLLLALIVVAGFGAYRALKYGEGRKRLWGLFPIALIFFGGFVGPFILGVMRGAGAKPALGGIGGGELLIVMVVGSLLLAVVSGAVLSLTFRPRGRR